MLRRAIDSRGSAADYRDADGNAGEFQRTLRVYDRAGEFPCRACGSWLRRSVLGDAAALLPELPALTPAAGSRPENRLRVLAAGDSFGTTHEWKGGRPAPPGVVMKWLGRWCGILLVVAASTSTASADTRFPRPQSLEPAISFWRAVFSRYSSSRTSSTTTQYLDRVYEVLDIIAIARARRNAEPRGRAPPRSGGPSEKERIREILPKLDRVRAERASG